MNNAWLKEQGLVSVRDPSAALRAGSLDCVSLSQWLAETGDEPPDAPACALHADRDPHVRWCGERGRETPAYPISCHYSTYLCFFTCFYDVRITDFLLFAQTDNFQWSCSEPLRLDQSDRRHCRRLLCQQVQAQIWESTPPHHHRNPRRLMLPN